MTKRLLAALVSTIVLQAGCEGDPPGCKEGNMVGDVCAGVPNDPVCDDDYCTQGVSCSGVIEVDSGSSFAAAVGNARAGTCIALGEGHYGSVSLPEGVSLLGRGADYVTIDGITTNGEGVTVRGVTVASGSVTVESGSTVIDMVRIEHSRDNGVTAKAGSTVTIKASEVVSAERYGVNGFDAVAVRIENSIVEGNDDRGGPGVWAQCAGGCDCAAQTTLSMRNVKLTGNRIVGLSIVGADATLDNVEVRNTGVGAGFEAGGGISASGCSTLNATDLRVIDNEDFGILIDDSSLNADGLEVSGNLRGVWIQAVGRTSPGTVLVRNGTLSGNRGVAIGVAQEAQNVTIEQTSITDTREITLPVKIDGISSGQELVANGITWKGLSQVVLNGVTVSRSDKQGVLIDGGVASGSTITSLVLAEGDQDNGILQQNFMDGTDQSPAVIDSPDITVTPDELMGVPEDIVIPPTI